jgi:hypothetical protein
MKKIEKITDDGDTMYFEKYSRKELKTVVNDFFANALMDIRMYGIDDLNQRNEMPVDEDSTLAWTLDDGTFGRLDSTTDWSDVKRPPVSRITNMYADHAGCCVGYFGKDMQLIKREEYGDWVVIGI